MDYQLLTGYGGSLITICSTISDSWSSEMVGRRGTIALYAGVMALLTLITGVLTWYLDIKPSMTFARSIGAEFMIGWNQETIIVTVLLISLMPNLFEFFTTGLALQGNIAINVALNLFILFDALTDAPTAYRVSETFVNYYVTASAPDWIVNLLVPAATYHLLAAPMLLVSTIIIKVLSITFLSTSLRLIRQSFEGEMSSRYASRRRRIRPLGTSSLSRPVSS